VALLALACGEAADTARDSGTTLQESIVLVIGEEYFGAEVMNLENGWQSSWGTVDGSLVQIGGTELTASGEFADGLEEVIEDGMLEGSCESAS
jgi:hypothetical protein